MPRLTHLTLALAVLALVAAGCTKKVTIDDSIKSPEGITNAGLELITFLDPTTPVKNTKTNVFTVREEFAPGTVRGFVVNRTSAEGLQVFRTDANGGEQEIFTAAVHPYQRYLDGLATIYEFADTDPHRAANASYTVRGLIGGVASAGSPISKASRPVIGSVTQIFYLPTLRNGVDEDVPNSQRTGRDSIITLKWSPVSGTDHYLIQVFKFLTNMIEENDRVFSGAASPLVSRPTQDFYVASVPGSTTKYKLGDPGATLYHYRELNVGDEYLVRISAVAGNGELIGCTTGPVVQSASDLFSVNDLQFPKGAITVTCSMTPEALARRIHH